ncbi:beta-xylosidase family glycoside hydrolase [Altererythrobacter sp. CAU 1778]
MKVLPTIAAVCLSGAGLAAQPAPVARFSAITIADSSGGTVSHDPVQLTAAGNLLSDRAPSVHAIDDPGGDMTVDVVLEYAEIADGDVAGLAIMQDGERWISLQTEPITPADLVAVRVHEAGDVAYAGRLLATAPLPGSFGDKVRLRMVRERGEYRFYFAPVDGPWQPLASAHQSRFSIAFDPSGAPTMIALHAFDGGERLKGDLAQ